MRLILDMFARRSRVRPGRQLGAAALAAVLGALLTPAAALSQAEVTGQVVDQAGDPVSGAQITVVGTRLGTLAGRDGTFTIPNVPAGEQELRAQSLGYRAVTQTVQVPAAGSVAVSFTLRQTAIGLDEIVVTGTVGDTRRRAVANAVAQIDAAEVVRTAPVANVQDLLNARAPGVVIIPGTGQVGSGARIRIRGISSLSLNQEPLLYVDGVRVNNAQGTGPVTQGFGSSVISRINDINPQDIESIEVIKGPAAATLYGTEASNGVIQIITRRGASGAPQFGFTTRQGANWFANPGDRIYTNWGPDPRTGEIVSINMYELELSGANRPDGQGQDLFRTGHRQSYDLNVSGGADLIRYYIAGNWERNEGIQPDNQVRRYGGRANLSVTPHETLDITASTGWTRGRTDLSWESGAGGITWSTYFASPTRLYNPDGTFHMRRGFWSGTPEVYYAFEDWQDVDRFMGSVQLTHRPLDWLTQRLTVGTDQTREENVELIERNEDVLQFFSSGRGYRSQVSRGVSFSTFDYSATGQFEVREGLSTSTSLGGQFYNRRSEFVSAYGEDFPAPGLRSISAAAVQRGSHDYVENTTVGVFGQQQLVWQDRLFLTGALRADDNSAFGEDFELVTYPKLSAAWVVSEEPFWTLPAAFDQLRLRAAYGQAGQQPQSFAALRTFAPVAGPDDRGVVSPQLVGNPNLGPERGSEVELGFDAGFLNDRLGVEFTFYDQTTRDAILLRQIAPSTGFSGSQFINAGEIRNRGTELLVRALPIATRNFNWDVTFTLATNDNEIVSLGTDTDGTPLEFVPAASYQQHRVGYPVSSWFERRLVDAEFDEEFNPVNLMCDDGAGGVVPCEDAPRVFLGRPTPTTEGSVNTGLSFGPGFRVAALLDFKLGHSKLEGDRRVRCWFFDLCRENYFPEEFDPVQVAGSEFRFVSDVIEDAGFAKLREVSASYEIPAAISGRFGADRATISLAGRNLFTWTDYPGMEPEAMFMSTGSRGGQGLWEQNVIPQLTQFVATINVNF